MSPWTPPLLGVPLDLASLGAALATGVAVAAAAVRLVRPAARLGPRLRPYTIGARARLGRPVEADGLAGPAAAGARAALSRASRIVSGLYEGRSDETLARQLEQAGLLRDVPEEERVGEYRVRQLVTALGWTAGCTGLGLVVGASPGVVLLLAGLGAVVGGTRWPGRLDRAVEDRRQRIRVEIYTVNHLLAMHLRTGAGVVQAVRRVTERARGSVVGELDVALTLHRSGRTVVEALEHIAARTPEPNAARTYRLLAGGVQYGSDLAETLRVLSDDLREQRLEALKREATRRRAAMLIPIVAVLAPVMLLFIAAPLPSLVLGVQ
jgi:tight adherence protein C